MKDIDADLHVHTALSPCAEPEMTPMAIVTMARRLGIEISATNANPPWSSSIDALTLPVLRSSDAHFLDAIGLARSRLHVVEPIYDELCLALSCRLGREVC